MSISSLLGQLVEIFRGWTPPTPTPTPTPDPYVLPPATAETLGGVKVGDGLEVAEDGTLSAQASGGEGAFIFEMETTDQDEHVYTLVSAPCTVAEFTERAQTGGLPYRVVLQWKDPSELMHCTELVSSELFLLSIADGDVPLQFSFFHQPSRTDDWYRLDVNNGEFCLADLTFPE